MSTRTFVRHFVTKPTRNMPPSGNVVRVKGPQTFMTTEIFSKPVRRTFFVADLKCYMCGSVVGSVESEQDLTAASHSAPPVLVRQSGHAQPTTMLNWRHLRCDRCGGPLFLAESDVVT